MECCGRHAVADFKILDTNQATSWVTYSAAYLSKAVIAGRENDYDLIPCQGTWTDGRMYGGKAGFSRTDGVFGVCWFVDIVGVGQSVASFKVLVTAAALSPPPASPPLCSLPASASYCGACTGYTVQRNVDHPDDDIKCMSSAVDNSVMAFNCNADPSCRAFVIAPNDPASCLKRASTITNPARMHASCFYTKVRCALIFL